MADRHRYAPKKKVKPRFPGTPIQRLVVDLGSSRVHSSKSRGGSSIETAGLCSGHGASGVAALHFLGVEASCALVISEAVACPISLGKVPRFPLYAVALRTRVLRKDTLHLLLPEITSAINTWLQNLIASAHSRIATVCNEGLVRCTCQP